MKSVTKRVCPCISIINKMTSYSKIYFNIIQLFVNHYSLAISELCNFILPLHYFFPAKTKEMNLFYLGGSKLNGIYLAYEYLIDFRRKKCASYIAQVHLGKTKGSCMNSVIEFNA